MNLAFALVRVEEKRGAVRIAGIPTEI